MKRLLFVLAVPIVQLAAAQGPAALRIASSSLEIRLNPQARGALESVIDRKSGRAFMSATKPSTLFRLTVVGSDRRARELTAADAAAWEHTVAPSGEELVLGYRNLGGQDLHVECRVRLRGKEALSYWRIAVENRSPWSVRTVVYPVLLARQQLGAQWADDRLLVPAGSGWLRRSLGPPTPFGGTIRADYPPAAAAQFLAYYDTGAGLYMAAYDGAGHRKHLGYRSMPEAVELLVEHNVPEQPGASWQMPYEVVLGTFHGDWYAAADIYKQWAHHQPWSARKLTERDDIPRWYLEGWPVVMFIPRAGEYYPAAGPPRTPDRYLTRPPLPPPGLRTRASALFAEVSRALHSPLLMTEYGWAKHGAWVTPDVFPPYGGEDSFREQIAALRRNGHMSGYFISGFQWSVAKPGRSDYDGWPAFRRDGLAAAVTGEDQQPVVNHYVWASNVALCPGHPLTQKILLGLVRGLVERGATFVQYDQPGVWPCWNCNHSHPGGYGVWMSEATQQFPRAAQKLGKPLNPDFVLTKEAPSEYHIQDVAGFYDRPYVIGEPAESVPVFSYLYHGYQLSYGGDSPLGVHCPEADLLRVARSFIAGELVMGPSFGPSREWPKEELDFLAAIVHAQRTFAHEYVILGTMLRAPQLENVPMLDAALVGGTREVPTTLGPTQVAAVIASAWKSPAGKTGYVLANVLQRQARPLLRVNRAGGWVKISEAGRQRLTVRDGNIEATLEPREIALVEEE